MDLSLVVTLVVVGLFAATVIGVGIRIFVKRPKVITGTEPYVWNGPDGRTVDIPARQISTIGPGALSYMALARYTGRSAVRVSPAGVQTLTLRTKTIPYESIVEVGISSLRADYVTLRYPNGLGVGVITSSVQAADALMYELSVHCRLSPPAWHRIARFVQPGPPQQWPQSQGPSPQPGPPPQQGPPPQPGPPQQGQPPTGWR